MLLGTMAVAGGPLMGLPVRAHATENVAGVLSLLQTPAVTELKNAEGLSHGRQAAPEKPAIIDVPPIGNSNQPLSGNSHIILT